MLQRNFDALGIKAEEPDEDAGSSSNGGAPKGLSLFALTSAMTRLQAGKLFYHICGAPVLVPCVHDMRCKVITIQGCMQKTQHGMPSPCCCMHLSVTAGMGVYRNRVLALLSEKP